MENLENQPTNLEELVSSPAPAPAPAPVIEPTKTETRGRHKKDCSCDKCLSKRGESTAQSSQPTSTTGITGNISGRTITDSNPLNLDEFKKAEGITTESQPQEVNAGKFITGGLMLIMIDAILPATIIKVVSIFNKDLKTIKTKEIRLSTEQMEDLEPLANEAIKGVVTTMSPMNAFVMALIMLYAGNTMGAIMDRKEIIVKPEKK